MNKDSDFFLNNGEFVGFRMCDCYIGVLNGKLILAFAKNNEDLVKELRKGSESGEVLKCDSFLRKRFRKIRSFLQSILYYSRRIIRYFCWMIVS